MPKMVKLAANPHFRPSTEQEKKDWEAAKRKAPMDLPYGTASENVAFSRGMYSIVYEDPKERAFTIRQIEDMTIDELKLAMVNAGVKTQKRMTRDEVIRLLRSKMDEVEIGDEPGEQ